MKTDRQYGIEEARRAFFEGCRTHAEASELAAAAHGGPARFAQRMRRTEFGSRDFPPDASADEYVDHLFGEADDSGDAYCVSYLAEFQAAAAYVRSVH